MSLGTVVVNEVVYPIEELALEAGALVAVFTVASEQAFDTTSRVYHVFDPDGVLVVTGRFGEDHGYKPADGRGVWRFTLHIRFVDGLTERARDYFDRGRA